MRIKPASIADYSGVVAEVITNILACSEHLTSILPCINITGNKLASLKSCCRTSAQDPQPKFMVLLCDQKPPTGSEVTRTWKGSVPKPIYVPQPKWWGSMRIFFASLSTSLLSQSIFFLTSLLILIENLHKYIIQRRKRVDIRFW